MTLEEAQKVAAIAENADNGCPVCVSKQAELLQEAFPDFEWRFEETKAFDVNIHVSAR